MKNHVLRPLWLAVALVGLILIARTILVPDDFGVHGKSFTFGFHRQGNIAEWQAVPVKYRGGGVCADCHSDNAAANAAGPHAIIPCENCHGPAADHPDRPEKLAIERDRQLCLRCHAELGYPNNPRSALPGIVDQDHNPGDDCVSCHNPHDPSLEKM
ncbi:MAG: cytochrome c3 family protein [Thermodesulfobacteriota bacterium]